MLEKSQVRLVKGLALKGLISLSKEIDNTEEVISELHKIFEKLDKLTEKKEAK